MSANSSATVLVAAAFLMSVATPVSAQSTPDRPTPDRPTAGLEDDLRDRRYCEILLGYTYAAKLNANVFNTIGYNYCPQNKLSSINLDTIATENAADVAILNGPRHWVLDAIEAGSGSATGETKNFGGIEMTRVGNTTQPLSALAKGRSTPYTTMQVARTTIWTYDAGKAVFELTDTSGNVYIMQAYSQQVDPNLKMSDLPTLGSRLQLPSGWTYTTRILDKTLNLNSGGRATVLQDDLENTYQMRSSNDGAGSVR